MLYPLVRELAATDTPIRVPVAATWSGIGLTRQPFYRWLEQPVTDAEREEAYRANDLFDAHCDEAGIGGPAQVVHPVEIGAGDAKVPRIGACGEQ